MQELDRLRQASAEFNERLAKLSQASLLITQSLDLDDILQGVADGACLITDAQYGALLVFGESGNMGHLTISGLSPDEIADLGEWPADDGLLGYLDELQQPLRLANIAEHPESAALPENRPPIKSFLAAGISHLGRNLGSLYLCQKLGGGEFTQEDEDLLVMFASQAAVAISNALNHHDQQQSSANWATLMDLTPVGVMVFDARTRNVTAMNQEAARIVGYEYGVGDNLDEIRGSRGLRYMDGREVADGERPVDRAINHGESMTAAEFVLVRADGSAYPTLFNTAPIFSEDDEVTSVIVVVQDLRPREEMERMRADFLGMVSHELRAPLTAIKGSAATALSSRLPPNEAETRQFFRIIDEQADQMRNLINNLLDVTRIEAGMLSVNTEPTELAFLVDQARGAFLGAGARNVVTVDLAPGLPPVRADRQRTLQVLNNLLSNAAKYSPDWSAIDVTASRDGAHVVVSVTDQGQGLTPDDLDRLFRKFSRIDDHEGRRTVGEGLGLAICKGIVESHGGRIWAESAGPGQGARFTFTIPVVDAIVNK